MQRTIVLAWAAVALLLSGCLTGGAGRSHWAYDATGIDAVRATGRDGRGVTIAILDTGINTQHPSLDHLVDADPGNGQLVAFRDFLGTAVGPREAFDSEGHGSHVAGILAARGGTGGLLGTGVDLAGSAPAANYVVGRVCAVLCDAAQLAAAIRWAAFEQDADIISMSLGGQFNLTDLAIRLQVEQAVNDAIDAGKLVIASAGNRAAEGAPDVESPADIPGVIAVGSVGRDGRVSAFSNRGSAQANECRPLPVPTPAPLPPLPVPLPVLPPVHPALVSRCEPNQKPELVAPGEGILSAWTGSDYYYATGTSQATPFVTGAVALLLEGRPDLGGRADVLAVKQALAASARPVPGQAEPHDDAAGYGRLDAAAALATYAGLVG